jgi:hypothetical protein
MFKAGEIALGTEREMEAATGEELHIGLAIVPVTRDLAGAVRGDIQETVAPAGLVLVAAALRAAAAAAVGPTPTAAAALESLGKARMGAHVG